VAGQPAAKLGIVIGAWRGGGLHRALTWQVRGRLPSPPWMLHDNIPMRFLTTHPLALAAGLTSRVVLAMALTAVMWGAVAWAMAA